MRKQSADRAPGGLGSCKDSRAIESGIRKLKNLAHIKSAIDVIGHRVQTVIWPHGLFGSEFMPLGFEYFERLRTKLTEVLMRRPKSAPWISCNVLAECRILKNTFTLG